MKTSGTITLADLVERCRASFDSRDDLSAFDRGVDTGNDLEYMTIAENNVWGGRTKSGGSVTSYEKIGYHTATSGFMLGVLSTGCEVRVATADSNGHLVWRDLVA